MMPSILCNARTNNCKDLDKTKQNLFEKKMNSLFRRTGSLLRRNISVEINAIKKGAVIQANNRLMVVLDSRQRSQARAGSHYKLELKDLLTGSKAFERHNAGSVLEVVELNTKTFNFLYHDAELHLIDNETFEDHTFDMSLLSGTFSLLILSRSYRPSYDLYAESFDEPLHHHY